jgi:catechol 2,3-dioxygenase
MTGPSPDGVSAERLRDIAHIGPVEMFTPTLEASRDFFVNSMALREVAREGDSV